MVSVCSAARRITSALAERYGDHPALALWHVHNEYGTLCWCDHAAAAFRVWLRARHGSLDALNEAWGTAFWSQHYTSWEQVLPPRATQYHKNPGQTVDFHRFWADEIIAAYCEQRDAIREHSDRPVTTNLMLPYDLRLNVWAFARELDVVSSDQYPDANGLDGAAHVAFYADRSRSLAGGRPWLLMEQGTSTVYDGDQVIGKEPGDVLRHSLGHIARGSEGALFFQWRQSRAGAETWHSAMLPHAGPDSRIFREVTQNGEAVARLGELAKSTVTAQVAVLDDPDAMWALEVDGLPSSRLDYHAPLAGAHRVLWDAGITADFAHPGHDLSRYRLVIAPSLFLLSDKGAENLRRYLEGGGTLLVQHATGYVDDRMHARLGGYPAAPLREALGIRVEPGTHPAPLRHRAGLVSLHPPGRGRLRRPARTAPEGSRRRAGAGGPAGRCRSRLPARSRRPPPARPDQPHRGRRTPAGSRPRPAHRPGGSRTAARWLRGAARPLTWKRPPWKRNSGASAGVTRPCTSIAAPDNTAKPAPSTVRVPARATDAVAAMQPSWNPGNTQYRGDVLATMEAKYADGSNASQASWAPYQEFNAAFSPDYPGGTIILTPDFLNALHDGEPVTLTFHFHSGATVTYHVTKSQGSVTGTTS